MDLAGLHARDLVALFGSAVIAGATAAVVARRLGGDATPLSECEQKCIREHPDDTQARLNCMLKCTSDGKISVQRVMNLA